MTSSGDRKYLSLFYSYGISSWSTYILYHCPDMLKIFWLLSHQYANQIWCGFSWIINAQACWSSSKPLCDLLIKCWCLKSTVCVDQGWTGTKNRPWHFLVQAAHHHHIIYIYIWYTLPFKSFWTVRFFNYFFKEVSSVHQACICLIQNTAKTVILWNVFNI